MRTLAALGTLLLLTSCGGHEPDMAEIERAIRVDLAEQVEDDVTLDCPDSIEWRVGETFRCVAEDSRGQRGQVTVTMENDEGEFTWRLD